MNNLIDSGEQIFNEFDSFFDLLTQDKSLNIDLTVLSSECNGSPRLEIYVDDMLISSQLLSEGYHQIQLTHPVADKDSAHIKISMSEKSSRDTKVVDGQIVKDKYILIERLLINNFDITTDFDLFYNKLRYTNNQGLDEPVKNGFWHNSNTLHIECSLPFVLWYNENTKKNINLSENLIFKDDKDLAAQQYDNLVNKLHLLK
jgi:hypothetical protein